MGRLFCDFVEISVKTVPHRHNVQIFVCSRATKISKIVLFVELFDGKKKDIEIQPGFEPGSSEFQSDVPTN